MNNWLAFSLSPQQRATDQNQTISTEPAAAAADACFGGLPADDSSSVAQQDHAISLQTNNAPFSILDDNNNSSPQDWSMKGGTSDLSMLVSTTSSGNGMEVDEHPKLEDFLGGTAGGYIFPNYSTASACTNGGSTIGLSMIKSWLRNQPVPASLQPQVQVEEDCDCGNRSTTTVGAPQGQGLSLSMSTTETTGSPMPLVEATSSSQNNNNNKQKGTACVNNNGGSLDAHIESGATEGAVQKKSIDTFGQRTSIYRGVTRHRWTGRYEAHLWDNSCRREGQTRKGRQVYLGGYDKEEKAARAYDLAALKYWGTTTTTNFPISNYEKELEEMKHMTRQEYVASLRRKSSGFSRGASIYRGVTRHHQHGRWQARIGRVAGNKDLYLGTFSTQEEAAEAYDIAAIKFRGLNAVTNFDMSRYDVKSILESSTLPIGGAAKRLRDVSEHTENHIIINDGRRRSDDHDNVPSHDHLTETGLPSYGSQSHHGWPTIANFQQAQPLSLSNMHYNYYGQPRVWCKQEHDSMIGAAQMSLQELQHMQLAGGTHNFFHPSSTVAFNGGGAYMVPMGTNTMMVDHGQSSNQTGGSTHNNGENENERMLLAAANSGYYMSQQALSGPGGVKESNSGYEQGNGCGNWVQSSVQAMAPRSASSHVTVCHGAPPLFTVWNDA